MSRHTHLLWLYTPLTILLVILILLSVPASPPAQAQGGDPPSTPLPIPPQESPAGHWTTYTKADGLGENNLRAIWGSPDGTVWVATWGGGVSRFDGASWQTFTQADGLASDWILSLAGDDLGNVWAAGIAWEIEGADIQIFGQGLSHFDSRTGQWTTYTSIDGLPQDLVRVVWPDGQGGVWLSTAEYKRIDVTLGYACPKTVYEGHGLTHFDPATGRWKTYTTADGLIHNGVRALWADANDVLWIGTDGGVSRYEPRTGNWANYTTADGLGGDRVQALWGDDLGNVWAGLEPVWDPQARQAIGGGVSRFDPVTNRWTTYTADDGLGGNNVSRVWAYDQDGKGHVWIANGEVAGGTCQAKGLSYWDSVHWHALTTADGLPEDWVGALWGDGHGTIWIGTQQMGAGRFDGRHWTKTLTSLGGLTSDDVTAVYGDNRGVVWVGTRAGLDRFETTTGRWTTYTTADGLPSNAIERLWVDVQGVPWAGTTYGLGRLDPYTGRWRTYTTADGLIDDGVSAIWADRAGAIWVATTSSAVSRFDPRRDRWESYTITDIAGQAFILDAWADESGHIWLGTFPGGLVRFQPETGETQFFSLEELMTTYVSAVWGDDRGNIWAGTLEGLYVFDARTEQWTAKYTSEIGLMDADILSLWLDDQGQMWAGGIMGLARYAPQTGDWTPIIQPSTADEMSSFIVQDLWIGDEGDVWLATEGGLHAYDPATDAWTLYTTEGQTGHRLTIALRLEPDGDLWTATTGGGVGHWDAASGEWMIYDRLGPLQSDVIALYRDHNETLWAADGWGVARFDPTSGQWTSYGVAEGFPSTSLTSLAVDKAGIVWAGSPIEGLMRFDPATGEGKTFAISDQADANWIEDLELDSSGAVWAGFRQKGGLARFDPVAETWTPYPLAEGAPGGDIFSHEGVWSLHIDAHDRVWAGTGEGLAQYDPAAGEWAVYTAADGLAPGYVQAIWTDANGTIWIGTDGSGLSRLDLSPYVPGERPRRWRRWKTFTPQNSGLSSGNVLALHGVPGSPTGDVLIGSDAWYGRYRPQPPQLILTATDAEGAAFSCDAPADVQPGTVTFDLSAVDFAHLADEIAYRWKLQVPGEPAPSAWHFLPNTRDEKHAQMTVSAVEPGEYVLAVAAGNLDYDWSAPVVCRFGVRDVSPPTVDVLAPLELDFDGFNAAGDNPSAVTPPSHFWQRVHHFTWQVPFSDNVTPPEQLTYRYNLAGGGIVKTGEYAPNQPPSVELPPGRYLLNVSAIDAAGAESASFTSTVTVPQPLAIQYLPYAGLSVLGLALLAVVVHWWWRRRSKFRYLDVALLARRAQTEAGHQIFMQTKGWTDAPHDLVDPTAFVPQGVLKQLDTPTGPIGPDADAALETLGTALYRALLSPEMRAHLAEQARRHHLRLRLSFVEGESDLDKLPWEFLHGGDGLGFLSTNPRTTLVRFQPPPETKKGPRLKTRLPLRVLVMIADAPNLPPLNVEQERDTLVALNKAPGRRFQVDLTEATLARLQASLEKGYDVVHFIGHGDVDEEGAFVYMLDARGSEMLVTPDDLGQVIRGAATPPKLVLFNACNTAAAGGNELGMAPVLMRNANLPAIIGMQYPISDAAAARFTEGFYNALIHHGQVDYAVAQGRKAIAAAEDTTPRDWACPVLYTQVADGIVFDRV